MNSCKHCGNNVDEDGKCYTHCIGSVIVDILGEEDGFPVRFLEELKELKKVMNEINSSLGAIADKYSRIQ